ncbi:polysaccharide deacetylase family protein [Methylobacter sp. Wu1]|uniref:polysaccharide deacetylase family protein n=1 Tax=Methylobacter sp. Wu1 TaxID=3119359 RepID=UPI002F930A15
MDDFFSGRLSAQRVNVVITFDDGYKSWVTNVLPILKRLELPGTFFISSGFVGLTQKEQSEFMRSKLSLKPTPDSIIGGLAVDDVKKLAEEGFTVGGHTVNHYNLAKIPDEAELRYEIAEDKQRLEKIIGGKVEYFAYPFGAFQHPDIDIPRLLRESGYKGAVTTKSGFNDLGVTHPYLLHREITYASMSGSVFKARALGNYDAVSFLKRQGKNINTLERKQQKA